MTFAGGGSDTVAEIAQLTTLDARAFFLETQLRRAWASCLRQVFDRLMGRSDQGVLRPKQAMGDGTHAESGIFLKNSLRNVLKLLAKRKNRSSQRLWR